MDRRTLAQAVAMLVMLAALLRWWPAASRQAAQTDPFGRGDPQHMLQTDWHVAQDDSGGDRARAVLLGMVRQPGFAKRYRQMLALVRRIEAEGRPDDVVQLRNCARNELWMFGYFLYPRRVAGRPREEGDGPDAAVLPESDWVLTAGLLDEPPGLDRAEDLR